MATGNNAPWDGQVFFIFKLYPEHGSTHQISQQQKRNTQLTDYDLYISHCYWDMRRMIHMSVDKYIFVCGTCILLCSANGQE